MQAGLLLLVHGEVTDSRVDFFDREKLFIQQKLKPIMDAVPDLKVVMEHITTRDAADFVQAGPSNLAASITPQHMLLNRNALFVVCPLSCLTHIKLNKTTSLVVCPLPAWRRKTLYMHLPAVMYMCFLFGHGVFH